MQRGAGEKKGGGERKVRVRRTLEGGENKKKKREIAGKIRKANITQGWRRERR